MVAVASIIISTSKELEEEVLQPISTISHNSSSRTMCRATRWCLGSKIIWWMKCTSNSNSVWSNRTRCWRTCRGSLSSQAKALIHLNLISLTKSSISSSTAWIMRISNISSSYPSNCSRISCLYLCLHYRQWWVIPSRATPSTSSSSIRWYQTWTHTSRILLVSSSRTILTK
jgi:hypothetical protein